MRVRSFFNRCIFVVMVYLMLGVVVVNYVVKVRGELRNLYF